MTKKELKAKYARIANDPSQLEMFKNDVIDGEVTGLPELPEGAESKVLVLQMQDGVLEWVEGGSSPSAITKGSVIKIAGDDYRVLSVNEDLTDCEVVHIGPTAISKFSNASPSKDPTAGVTFIVDGVEKIGLKYKDSVVDQACESFYDDLPADVKAAIIEQEVEQDMYDRQTAEGTEDFIIDNTAEGGDVYRIKKINDAPVAVGLRHAYALSCGAIKEYFGGTSVNGLDVAKIFPLGSWLKDADSDINAYACCLITDLGNVFVGCRLYYITNCVNPAFHVNLSMLMTEPQPVMPDESASITITENGVYNVAEYTYADVNVPEVSPTPSEPPVKGDIILFGGHRYRVLKANNWDIEVMCLDMIWSGPYNSNTSDPEHQVTFQTADGEKTGQKYAGSDIDTYVNETWYATLPQEIKDAIIEQEIAQDMYDTATVAAGTEDFSVNQQMHHYTYRVKKVSTSSVAVGSRKIYIPGVQHLIDYLGSSTTSDLLSMFFFEANREIGTYGWLNSANLDPYAQTACCVFDGIVKGFGYASSAPQCARATFHINLQHISWTK